MLSITEASSTRATALLGPLGPGLGHVLGNALRRVLLSSMVGYAPTEVTIAGVLHEYSTIDGVHEDVVHVMLNLKGVVFKLHNRDEVTLVLRKEGEGSVRASDIQTPHDVEVINPDHVIANLSKGGRLDMQIKVEKGRGNVQGDALRRGSSPMIGRMVLDASFSPVRRVSYAVESARVGQCTDLDKLVMEIETNGAISPEEAIRASATILVEQLLVFASLASAPASPPVAPPPSTAVDASEGLDRPLDSLDLSVRARNSLAAENITTLKQLIQHTETDLLKTPNLGRKSLNEIATVLQALGLSLAQPQ